MSSWQHDPDAHLDYRWDWTAWLGDDETITDAVVEVETGHADVDQVDIGDGTVTAWLTDATPGMVRVVCRITTDQGRIDDRSIRLSVRNR